jgi:uncharacterized circularly permuted ATP-grasp superfamily protein
LAKSKEIVVKTIKSLDDLTSSGDTDISRIVQSIYARLDKATATTEVRAAGLDEQIDQVLGGDLINQQLAERKKKLAEKNTYLCIHQKHFQQSTGSVLVPTSGFLSEYQDVRIFNLRIDKDILICVASLRSSLTYPTYAPL